MTSQRLDRARGRWYASAVSASASVASRGRRPIVPFLRLPDAGEPHLVGQRCKPCGAVYLGTRRACSRCTAEGPFEEIPLSRKGTVWVWSIVHQSMPGVPVPYVVGVVDLPEGVAVRCNLIDVEPDPAKLRIGIPVEVVFADVTSEMSLPRFRPVPA